jgi:hypothetical protein
MEELAGLMLTMDIEDQGEPSFVIHACKRGSSSIHDEVSKPASTYQETSMNLISSVEGSAQVSLREQLLDSFTRKFNPFHQFLEPNDPIHLAVNDPFSGNIGVQLRNNALFAVGAYFSDIEGSSDLGASHANDAELLVLQCMREAPSDLVAQALSLLAWRELMLGNDSMAYNYIGELAIRRLKSAICI